MMRTKTILSFLCLLSASASVAQLPAASVPGAALVITPDNVELSGAGTFSFKPEVAAFDVDPPAGGEGLAFTVRLWFDAADKPVSCDPGAGPMAQPAGTACAQLLRLAIFQMHPGMTMAVRRGFIDVRFSFFKDPPGEPPGVVGFAFMEPAYNNRIITYPRDESAEAERLKSSDGDFSFPIQADDYPVLAMRYELESASEVMLGIKRDGSVGTCRPVGSDTMRSAFLDNFTCVLFLRRGRFAFRPDHPAYDGVRYLTKRIQWALPQNGS